MFYLSNLITNSLDFLAIKLNLGYLISLILMTIILKMIFIPSKIASHKNKTRKKYILEELERIDERKRRTHKLIRKKALKIKKMKLYKENNIISWKSTFPLIFFQFFIIIQFIHSLHAIDFEKGNLPYLWFNLANRDFTFILPLLVFTLNLIEGYPKKSKNFKIDLTIYLILNVLILLFAIYLPSSILIYWISGTCFFIIIEFLWLKEKHIKQFETGNI
ncbi:YidC/Oxa1 family membrane protein insertase [Peribacillus simplex]|uniref:YidC/Oxa1 family membrane protein insertase n=1 Tax=Peribacillus simplex TaxID=1478 RepID=UPI0025A0ECB1|nr:YidC/Oxa1 family membrane protein insertase [Peribacillus simplex]MDM5292014.1 YidC/Oxa1 family membrane protein insertase [Peribacillus simplex]